MASNTTFAYQNSYELREIEQDLLPSMESDYLGSEILPTTTTDEVTLIWEQMDNFIGLQQARGLDGLPSKVNRIGSKRYEAEPGVYGEFTDIDERELTKRAELATRGMVVDISDLVAVAQHQLLQRRLDRLEYIRWTLLTTGTYLVASPDGGYITYDRFNLSTITAGTAFSNLSASTPLQFFRDLKKQHRGHSSVFNKQGKIYANTTTVNNILNNTNSADFGGKRTDYGATVNMLGAFNQILLENDLPSLVEYDKTYQDDTNTAQTFIPDSKMVAIGKRTSGAAVGEYRMTRNVNNPAEQGAYSLVWDSADHDGRPPRRLEVHDGHNGGPVIFFPSAVKILSV